MLAAVAVAVGACPRRGRSPPSWRSRDRDGREPRRAAKLVEGVAALKRGDHQAALTRFEEAYALVPSPKIHYDFGLAYVGLGRTADALAAFERFLAEAPDAPPDSARRRRRWSRRCARASPRRARNDGQARGRRPPPARRRVQLPDKRRRRWRRPPEARRRRAPTASDDPLRTRRITRVGGRRGRRLARGGPGVRRAGATRGRQPDARFADGDAARPTPFDPGKESRGLAYERLQVIALVAGAVAVAAGAALYATSRRRVVVEPVAGQSFAGATLRLTF